VQTTISLLAACPPVLAPVIAADRGWSTDLVALYAPIAYSVAFLISFVIPRLLSYFGGMGLSLACVAVSFAGLLFLLSSSIMLLLATPIAIGLAAGAMNPASTQVLGPRTTNGTAALVMSIKQTGVPLGGVLVGVVAPILTERYGWETTVVILSAGAALLTVSLLPLVSWLNGPQGMAKRQSDGIFEPIKRLLAIPGMWRLMFAGGIFSAMLVCFRSFFTVYLVNDLGLSLTAAGVAFAASQVSAIVGQVTWAFISDRWFHAHRTMGLIGALMAGAALATSAAAPEWPPISTFVIAIVYGGTACGFIPVVLGEIARTAPPGAAGSLTGGANLIMIGGVIVGPLIFGTIIAVGLPYSAAFILMAGMALTTSVIVARGCGASPSEAADLPR
jgi:MFS family permease